MRTNREVAMVPLVAADPRIRSIGGTLFVVALDNLESTLRFNPFEGDQFVPPPIPDVENTAAKPFTLVQRQIGSFDSV